MQKAVHVAVLDAGGQYVDLVRKAVERQGFLAKVLPLQTPLSEIEDTYDAIIMSGSPASSHMAEAPKPDAALWQTSLPFLGICYGQQAMTLAFGGEVKTGAIREDGRVMTHVNTSHPVFAGVKAELTGLFTHGDFVTSVPRGFEAIGQHTISDGSTVFSAIAKDNFIGVQFHPEVFDDTPEGYVIFENFLQRCAELVPDKSLIDRRSKNMVTKLSNSIRKQVGDKQVIAFASGGIDSTVATLLAAKALKKEQLHIFYIDNGFMRREDEAVIEMLQSIGVPVRSVPAADTFRNASIEIDGKKIGPLISVTDPEEKRKIIGQTFVDIKNQLIKELDLDEDETLLLQGTNAADRIESGHSKGGAETDKIKTHHNQVQAIKDLEAKGLLIEPLDELFKDEIRQLAHSFDLPEEVVWRQPFPGPGLAIRILTADKTSSSVDKSVQKKLQDFVGKQDLESCLLPVRSVGVGGDSRSHMSAALLAGKPNWSALALLATDVPAHFRSHINRVVYRLDREDLSEPSLTLTDLGHDVAEQLRSADAIVFEEMRSAGLIRTISQFPVVLLPLSFGEKTGRTIVLRPVITNTFMTVQAALPERDLPSGFLEAIAHRIKTEVAGITAVCVDLTNKPPGTTEWE